MKMKPLQQWICDTCNGLIEKPEHGVVEWLIDKADLKDWRAYNFRIIHKTGHCPYYDRNMRRGNCSQGTKGDHIQDEPLTLYIGSTGIANLANFIDKGVRFKDGREFAELVRRFHLPYYEEARLYWQDAINDGFFEEANELSMYLPETLERLIEEYGNR